MNNTTVNKYVLGFVFNEIGSHVLLQRKTKPDFLAGKLNGIGGKIEPDESPLDAMVREAKEETGLSGLDWSYYAKIKQSHGNVLVYASFSENMWSASQLEEESIAFRSVSDALGFCNVVPQNMVPNVPALISSALEFRNNGLKELVLSY